MAFSDDGKRVLGLNDNVGQPCDWSASGLHGCVASLLVESCRYCCWTGVKQPACSVEAAAVSVLSFTDVAFFDTALLRWRKTAPMATAPMKMIRIIIGTSKSKFVPAVVKAPEASAPNLGRAGLG